MSQVIDLDKRFDDWFNKQEGFGLRSERFYTSLIEFNTREAQAASMLLWLKAAYLHGIRVAAHDSVATLGDYATACAGLDAELTTATQCYDNSADALGYYWTLVFEGKE